MSIELGGGDLSRDLPTLRDRQRYRRQQTKAMKRSQHRGWALTLVLLAAVGFYCFTWRSHKEPSATATAAAAAAFRRGQSTLKAYTGSLSIHQNL